MDRPSHNIAMLIDADNASASSIEYILAELANYGVVNIRRAYGNWASSTLSGWKTVLHEYAIRPEQQFDYTKGKNATDMAMTIDAMDLLYGKQLDAFCIVSSDSDFTPLVMRILADGLLVYGFGRRTAATPFVNACSKFLYLETLAEQAEEAAAGIDGERAQGKRSGNDMKGDARLMNLLRAGIDAFADEDGWASLGAVGQHISNHASFDPRNHGYRRLSDLVRAIDILETRREGQSLYVRDRRRAARSQ